MELKRQEAKDRQWAVPGPQGQRIILRDVFSKVAQWVKRFIEVGDTLVQVRRFFCLSDQIAFEARVTLKMSNT